MHLAAMMRLVVEEMRDEQTLRRADFAPGGAAEPYQIRVEPVLVDLRGPGRNTGIGLFARRAQLGEILDEMVTLLDRRRRARPVVETTHPLVVAPQYVDQRAMDRAPERAFPGAPLGLAEPFGGAVQAAVHLGVVGGHRADIGWRDHRRLHD